MEKCKHCHEEVEEYPHHCKVTGQSYEEDDSGSFLLSMAIGMGTNAVVGGLLGGDLAGGIVGDILTPGGLF